MDNYQPPHYFTLNHPSDNNTVAQSGGSCHTVQHIQGAMGNTLAHSLPTQTPEANHAGEVMGSDLPPSSHARINFHPTHTCATCKAICQNNYGLEKHAAKERHQAFVCTCGTDFGRLGSFDRHVAAQNGPKYYCDYCDDSKGFARLDKLVDHLQGSHKFGKNAVAQFRNQARAESKRNGPTSSMVPATGAGQPLSTSDGHDAGSGAVSVGQVAFSAATSAGTFGSFDTGSNDFPVFIGAELQPLIPVGDYSWIGAAEDLAGFDISGLDFSGVDFADFDGNMDLSGMDDHL